MEFKTIYINYIQNQVFQFDSKIIYINNIQNQVFQYDSK